MNQAVPPPMRRQNPTAAGGTQGATAPLRPSTWRKAIPLAIGGGTGFWLANLAISLTPFAAEYRSALSISYVPMLLGALLGGLIIGYCVGYCLLRFHDAIPARSVNVKVLVLGLLAVTVVTMLVEVPAKLHLTSGHALRYFLFALVINTLRILTLAIVIGLQVRVSRSRG